MKRLVGVSVDVDSVASHLVGYGFERPDDPGQAYERAVPRALKVFAKVGIRGTFFLIADEAVRFPEAVRTIAAAGHEVGCHSMSHPIPFADLDPESAKREICESKAMLEELVRGPVVGFRAPGWDITPTLLPRLAEAGYAYDASSFPSPLVLLMRRSIARRSCAGRTQATRGVWSGVFARSGARRRQTSGGPIWEFPVGTTPVLRLPYYHTLRFVAPVALFSAVEALARSRRGPLSYVLHAVDFLGTAEDDLDPRIRRHPGMERPLDVKIELARSALRALVSGRVSLSLARIIEVLEGSRRA